MVGNVWQSGPGKLSATSAEKLARAKAVLARGTRAQSTPRSAGPRPVQREPLILAIRLL